jgi:hypothetical protein
MTKIYLLSSLLAVSFFSYAQYRGMSIYTGGAAAQQLSGPGGYSRSSSLSHK